MDPSGPIHITVGAGGRKCEAPFSSETPEPWVEVRDATIYGYGMFRILNSTHGISIYLQKYTNIVIISIF